MAIDFSKRPKGMSKREYAASVLGGTKNDYNEDGSPRSGGSSSGGNNLSSIVDEILGATPGFNSPSQSFDDFYNERQQTEDQKASEALFNPWYEQQISDTMEDLNSYIEMDSVSYKRTLRQGRAKMAQLGGAIGSERTNWEGDVTDEMERTKNQRLRNTERMVGSDAMLKAGYQSFYGGGRVGTLIDERNAAIEDQKLWYRDQAMGQYNSSANATYQRPSSLNFLGGRL